VKLASLPPSPPLPDHHHPGSDGRLVVVSTDLRRAVDASRIAPTLTTALQRWDVAGPALGELADRLERGELAGFGFDPASALAPLPRAPEWLIGATFTTHRRLLAAARDTGPSPAPAGFPPVLRGASDSFRSPTDDIAGYRMDDRIDFNGGFGVVVDDVPRGITVERAADHIKLVVLLNDVSLRAHAERELGAGAAPINAAPATTLAPVAVSPDELGPSWEACRVHRRLLVEVNGQWFGHPDGSGMSHGFDELIAYCARTRQLAAGTVLGSGTVSTADPSAGTACIAERRARELLSRGEPSTPFLTYGDRVRLRVEDDRGHSIFGPIDQVCQPAAMQRPSTEPPPVPPIGEVRRTGGDAAATWPGDDQEPLTRRPAQPTGSGHPRLGDPSGTAGTESES
jgi:fumarylacetoacetate (FAA) hydrolase